MLPRSGGISRIGIDGGSVRSGIPPMVRTPPVPVQETPLDSARLNGFKTGGSKVSSSKMVYVIGLQAVDTPVLASRLDP